MIVAIVCGDRGWTDRRIVRAALEDVRPDVVIHGGAPGAEAIAAEEAADLGIVVGLIADEAKRINGMEGYRRVVIAVHNWLDNSKGTRHTIALAKQAGIPVRLYSQHDLEVF